MKNKFKTILGLVSEVIPSVIIMCVFPPAIIMYIKFVVTLWSKIM